MNTSSNSKFKNLDELKAKMASKSGGSAGGGFGGGSVGGGFGGGSVGGFGGGFGAKVSKKQQQIIIEEDNSNKKLFDFDMNQVDKSILPPKDYTKTIMVCAFMVVSLLFGIFIGWCWYGVLSDRGRVNERIDVAQSFEPTVSAKIDAFQTYAQFFKQRSESLGAGVLEYNEDFYQKYIANYKNFGFVLDVSADLPEGAFVMASNASQNPLSDLRGYGAGTTLLAALLDSHIEQTEADMTEITALLGKSSATDRNIVYALKVDKTQLYSVVATYENTDRLQRAVESEQVYQVKRAITDDVEAAKVFQQLHESGELSDEEFKARTYVPAKKTIRGKKVAKPIPEEELKLTLPNRLMYVIEDGNGKQQTVFADDIIMVERTKLFAGSANALERYRKRMIQILAILGEVEKTTDGLQSRIHVISSEEKI